MNLEQLQAHARIIQAMQDKTPFVIDWQDRSQSKHYITYSTLTGNYLTDFSFKYRTIGVLHGSLEACQFIIDNHKQDLDILRGAL